MSDADIIAALSPVARAFEKLGDETSERQWRDVLGVLKVQEKPLDYDYMRRWAADIDVFDLLERALEKARF